MDVRTMVWTLTLSGAIPFVAGAAALWLAEPGALFLTFQVLMLYAAIILTFVGAVRWGHGLCRLEAGGVPATTFLFAVAPAFWSWIALLAALPLASSFGATGLAGSAAAMAAAYVAMLIWDLRAVAAGVLPAWYRWVRIAPSLAAVASLLIAGAALLRAG